VVHAPGPFETKRPKWTVVQLPRHPSALTHPGFEYKLSLRNSIFERSVSNRTYTLPYISSVGHITIHTAYQWKCDPIQLVNTLIATVYSRLKHTMCKRYDKKTFTLNNLLLRLSVYYVFTKNDYLLDRILGILKGGSKPSHESRKLSSRLIYGYELKLSETTRFVLRQVVNSADWLKLRRGRSRPSILRDKLEFGRFHYHVGDASNMLRHEAGCVNGCMIHRDLVRVVARVATTFSFSSKDLLTSYRMPDTRVLCQRSSGTRVPYTEARQNWIDLI